MIVITSVRRIVNSAENDWKVYSNANCNTSSVEIIEQGEVASTAFSTPQPLEPCPVSWCTTRNLSEPIRLQLLKSVRGLALREA